MWLLERLEHDVRRAMRADRHRFRRELRSLRSAADQRHRVDRRLAGLAEEIGKSVQLRRLRRAGVPRPSWDPALPICAKRADIATAIRDHPVVIVCGETGSGKSTQLPKMCLELGRGIDGLIGHTQPRRIAARSVAARIADELRCPLGTAVGFKVRFAEALGRHTYIKLMTDGILLAETQSDPFFDQYDTIILDEAHERSLNIDFLIGYLKRLLPKRRDLRLIITSATIDVARFAAHFATPQGPAPVIEVSGRAYPVEVRYRPPLSEEEGGEPDLQQAVLAAVDELAETGPGDILVFMPTERDIHETAKSLRGRPIPGDPTGRNSEILPLYARLSLADQQRVFQPGRKRRIVIATNVAESSLTVPGIRYVIDPGTARISRYSPRSKTQRLPIEPISQASAEQRKGRCGRIGPGVCIRLFSEEDLLARDRFTVPEIQRTNLAAVILQTKALRLGEVERFPFLDPPRREAVRDGYKTLFELGALDEQQELTEIGRRLSRLPVDPRIGRMILAAAEEDCLHEVLIIAAALAVQDPRERPAEKQEAADAAHAQLADAESDFLGYLKLWDFYHHLKQQCSRSQLRKACRQNFLSYNRLREWADVRRELLELAEQAGLKQGPLQKSCNVGQVANLPETRQISNLPETRQIGSLPHAGRQIGNLPHDAIHRAVLTGLLSNLAVRGDGFEYRVAGGGTAYLWPGSGIFAAKPKWAVAAELVETTRRYLRCGARIDPRWIEPLAGHLLKRRYSNVRWDREAAAAMALEWVALFGLTIVAGRPCRYGPIDPEAARHLLLQEGLVEGQWDQPPEFLLENQALLEEMERLQAKLRRRDLLLGESTRYEFYDGRIPAEVYDGQRLGQWLGESGRDNVRLLCMKKSDLLRPEAAALDEAGFPDALTFQRMRLPLEYRFEPGDEADGITLSVPLEALSQLDAQRLDWLVPGLLEKKILAMIRSLPKSLRAQLVPAPETAQQAAPHVRFGEGSIRTAVAAALGRVGGREVPPEAFQEDRLPPELRMNVRVLDAAGKTVAVGRDIELLRRQLGATAAETLAAVEDPRWTRDRLVRWDFGELPAEVEVTRGPLTLKAYPALIDRETSVSLRLADSPERAAHQTRCGLRRLFCLAAERPLRTQVEWFPDLPTLALWARPIVNFDLKRQLAELIADRAFLAEQPSVRCEREFQQQLAAGGERIPAAVQEVAALVCPLLEGFQQARLALEEATNPHWQYAVEDIRRQLDGLAGPRFLSGTPWNWLQQYPRYFGAVRVRLENITTGAWQRDRRGLDEFLPYWQMYAERAREHASRGTFDPELSHLRWMLEEFRVSLFAQRLGTAIPVSAKRLEQQWAKVRE